MARHAPLAETTRIADHLPVTIALEPEVPSNAPIYSPSATVEDFIYAVAGGPYTEFRLLMLQSSRGEGKTIGAIFALAALAERMRLDGRANLLPIRVAVLRDSFVNIQRTTMSSLKKSARLGIPLQWQAMNRECVIGRDLHLFFFGLDTRDDVDKLQGFECGVLWLEEVAPGAELDQGLPAETLGIGRTSVRQEGVPKRILVTFNPPDEDHWILKVEEHLQQLGLDNLVVHRFTIPTGEKSAHFRGLAQRYARQGDFETARRWQEAAEEFDVYRSQNVAFLESIGRYDLAARLGRGEIGGVQIGEAVIPQFSQKLHVTDPGERLIPMPGSEMWRGHDGGGTPSTVWVEITPAGNVNVHGSRLSINKDMPRHLLDEVLPFQEKSGIRPRRAEEETGQGFGRGRRPGWDFQDTGDPSLWDPDYSTNAELSAGLAIQEMLRTTLIPAPREWAYRREAGLLAFSRPAAGGARNRMLIRLQREECKTLIMALGGRAHYPVDLASGRINLKVAAAKRASGQFFQELDSLLYVLAVKFPAHEWLRRGAPDNSRTDVPPAPDWLGV